VSAKIGFIGFEHAVLMDRELAPRVIPSLLKLQEAGFQLVPVLSHADEESLKYFSLLESQGIELGTAWIHPLENPAAIFKYMANGGLNEGSFVMGGPLELKLSELIPLKYIDATRGWEFNAKAILSAPRHACYVRQTKETSIEVKVTLDGEASSEISTGVGFFDHMLEQLAKHGGFGLSVKVAGDLHIDEHHTVEDTALAIGETLKRALGDKRGIGRYGFVLPMDEAETRVSIDLSGRAYLVFDGKFPRDSVGGLPTELVPHFYRSFADSLGATLHIEVRGENAHHMVESTFKGLGRALKPALALTGQGIPSTKGTL
jgi:imidazoleglycerol-phosphate dehydratase / histidinol-phosphatase